MNAISGYFAKNPKITSLFVLGERAFKMLSQLFIIFLMARLLPQEEMGEVIYAYLICSSLFFLNSYGIEQLQVDKMVKNSHESESFICNYFCVRLITSSLCVVACVLFAFLFTNGRQLELILLVSIVHYFYIMNFFDFYFQGSLRQYLASFCLLAGGILSFAAKFVALYFDCDIYLFTLFYISDWFFCGFFFLFFVKKDNKFFKAKLFNLVNFSQMGSIIRNNSGMMIAAGLSMIYMKIDQILVNNYVGSAGLSVYSVPIRLSEAGFFLCTAIVSATYPKLLHMKISLGEKCHTVEMANFIFKMFWGIFSLCVIVSFMSNYLIVNIFGSEFKDSAIILSITVFSVPFVFLGAVATRLLIEDGLKGPILWRSVVGLSVNVVVCVTLVPFIGLVGASFSFLITHVVASFLIVGIFPDTRHIFRYLFNSVFVRKVN